jgi:aminoglycoside phosphotransferase (APT) family kinase protein
MKQKYTIEQIQPFVEKFVKIDKIEFLGKGYDSEAFCVNNEFVFKFPKHKNANTCLKHEIDILKRLVNIFEIEIPNVIYESEFTINKNNFVFFVSKKLTGENLTKTDFLSLGQEKSEKAAKTIARFLKTLHSINKHETTKEIVLLHGDLSLNHVLFKKGEVSGILDFADNHKGNYKEDFKYLLDDDDPEEFGKEFGEMVLKYYLE